MSKTLLKSTLRTLMLTGLAGSLLVACENEPPPRSVDELVNNPRMLEATMVRCSRDIELKYTQECSNAREAVDRIATRDEAASKAAKEAESARKREALRRAQRAAEEARARAEEAERLQREIEYLNQFQEVPPSDDGAVREPISQPPEPQASE